MDRLPTREPGQQGCFVSLGLVVVGGIVALIAQAIPSLETAWRLLLGSGALVGAWTFVKMQVHSFRIERAAFESQLAEFPEGEKYFYRTDQGWLTVSHHGIGTSYRPMTTMWSDFDHIKGITYGFGRNVHHTWWKSDSQPLPRVEQVDEPWLLIVSGDPRGHFQFITCPPKLEPKIWFRILKSQVEQKDIREFPETKFRPSYMRNGGGLEQIGAFIVQLFFSMFLLAVAVPGGIPERFLWVFMVLPHFPEMFSRIKRKPDVKPEAIARHFAALNGYEAPLVEHQVFGPASGKLFIGSETNLLDILEIEKLSSVELVTSKSSVVSRDIKNLKEPGPPITKLKLTYPRDHDSEYTLVLPTDHAQRLYNSLLAERPDLKIFSSTDLIPQPT